MIENNDEGSGIVLYNLDTHSSVLPLDISPHSINDGKIVFKKMIATLMKNKKV